MFVTMPKFKARPLNKKILEAPTLVALQHSIFAMKLLYALMGTQQSSYERIFCQFLLSEDFRSCQKRLLVDSLVVVGGGSLMIAHCWNGLTLLIGGGMVWVFKRGVYHLLEAFHGETEAYCHSRRLATRWQRLSVYWKKNVVSCRIIVCHRRK
eukprot:Gb_08001 [translate_table: standard]